MTTATARKPEAHVTPYSLQDAPAVIQHVFPAQKISAEAQKERKAGAGQTLTALGSYWKGRKPLILVRAIVIGSLMPASNDLRKDLEIYEKLVGVHDDQMGLRFKGGNLKKLPSYDDLEQLSPREDETEDEWDRRRADVYTKILSALSYDEMLRYLRRPEEVSESYLIPERIWLEINDHLGTDAWSLPELVEQLGVMRFGHRPRVGDTFCGGGSIPFEAARLGCDVYASDLNPVACMLTWGALNIIGADDVTRFDIVREQQEVADAVDREITELGIEHNEYGERAKAFLYCLETTDPDTGWRVPMAPSWVISKTRNVCARLAPDHENKRFDIEIVSNASDAEMQAADQGTVQKNELVYQIDGHTYRKSIASIRGDYRDENGVNRNKLRKWEKHDFKPRPGDIFQERLYCVQWYTGEGNETAFRAPTEADLQREQDVDRIVGENLADWQERGLVPDMPIEPGEKTDEPIRTRGWTYWHHLFNSRHILIHKIKKSHLKTKTWYLLPFCISYNSKLSFWDPESGGGGSVRSSFYNQSVNPLYSYGTRSGGQERKFIEKQNARISFFELNSKSFITCAMANKPYSSGDIYVTDPPYADAVNYHEITEFFIAWLRKNPPAPFDQWTWDSRRSRAIQGSGADFRKSMVDAYTAMANNMPDNGLQCVMFTHQSTSVWSDMVSIFWAAGLQVVGAWYIATERASELRKGGHVQGTVILMLRKRPESRRSGFTQRILPKVQAEVNRQVREMMNLRDQVNDDGQGGHAGTPVFNDSDLQMAGYAAALKVLTGYTEINGEDVTQLATDPRRDQKRTVVDDIVEQAAESANELLVPEGLSRETWEAISGVQRFYLKMLDIEADGARRLDNYQNFAKAFRVESYADVMHSLKPNNARLKGAQEFKAAELGPSREIGRTPLGALLVAVREVMNDKEPSVAVQNLATALDEDYFAKREHLVAIAEYIAGKLRGRRDKEADAAEVIGNRIRNERL